MENKLANFTVSELEMELARRRNFEDFMDHNRHWGGLYTVQSPEDMQRVQNQGQQAGPPYYGADPK